MTYSLKINKDDWLKGSNKENFLVPTMSIATWKTSFHCSLMIAMWALFCCVATTSSNDSFFVRSDEGDWIKVIKPFDWSNFSKIILLMGNKTHRWPWIFTSMTMCRAHFGWASWRASCCHWKGVLSCSSTDNFCCCLSMTHIYDSSSIIYRL